jgi:hypothetical protein
MPAAAILSTCSWMRPYQPPLRQLSQPKPVVGGLGEVGGWGGRQGGAGQCNVFSPRAEQ